MANKKLIAGAAVAVAALAYVFGSAVYVEEGKESELTGQVEFNSDQVVLDFWNNKANDYFAGKAVDTAQLVKEANGDFTSVAKKYGRYSMGDSGALSFIVKGTGTVTKAKVRQKGSGYLELAVDGIDPASNTVRLQIGPVYKGMAVRDSISLINYADFKNQEQWAAVSVAFFKLVSDKVVAPVRDSFKEGAKVEYTGCFTVSDVDPARLDVVPVSLKVSEQ
jgi:predicted lipoprotein